MSKQAYIPEQFKPSDEAKGSLVGSFGAADTAIELVDYQAEAQAILDEKTKWRADEDHKHTLKGHDFIIHKNAAIAVADLGKLSLKKDKEFKKILDYILKYQKLYDDLNGILNNIDGILDDIEVNDKIIHDAIELHQEDDMEGMIELLKEQDRYREGMSEDEVRNATLDLIGDKITEQADLMAALDKEIAAFEEKIKGLDENDPRYQKLKEQFDKRRDRLREIAGEKKLNYQKAENYLWKNRKEGSVVLKQENNYKIKAKLDKAGENTIDVKTEVASNDTSETSPYDDPYGSPYEEIKGKAKNDFKAVAFEDPYAALNADKGGPEQDNNNKVAVTVNKGFELT